MKKIAVSVLSLLLLGLLASCGADPVANPNAVDISFPYWAIGNYASDGGDSFTITEHQASLNGKALIPPRCQDLEESEPSSTQYIVSVVGDGFVIGFGITKVGDRSDYIVTYIKNGMSSVFNCHRVL